MLSTKYDPARVEDKWYSYWMERGFFHSEPNPDKEPYCIVIPPPNVTGVLHMGHMLNNTIQDVLIRKARMEGKEACWVPGTDHASIATEARVVAMLREKGIKKSSLTREEFLKYAWEWKEKYGGIILEQLKKLGASCDWKRTKFTMDDDYYAAVIDVFIDLYQKGYIYRGMRMINWDPVGRTALSDDEVQHREVQSKLYYIRYPLEGSDNEFVTIATVRPETIMADTAVCINPKDERFRHLKGRHVYVPLINRRIPIIEDEYVSMEFGTGCLKVTPAHDANDYELGVKHNLEVIDILNEDGTLNEKAQILIGEDRFDARKKIAQMLEEKGYLAKVEDYTSNVGFSERTHAVIEPRLSLQWFVRMKELTRPALENVMNDNIRLIPAKFKNTYSHWMENVRDWCISRQLWWGHRIPAWYDKDGKYVVARTKEEAIKEYRHSFPDATDVELTQDPDVLDTWFSSWLWPIAVFDTSVFRNPANKGNRDLNYYYPTNDLVTAPEILFFWVARMIIAGYEYRGEKPFRNVYLTGIVRDNQGRKMSKSLGNSPDALELIAKYGADAVRTGMLFSSPAGNDLLYDEKLVEQGRNFANKIWNAFRLVKGWKTADIETSDVNVVATEWFEARLNNALTTLEDHFTKFRVSDALMTLYKLIWEDFCSWYLEMIKPEFGKPIDAKTYSNAVAFFETVLKALHPFMPFITEELWQELSDREEGASIMVAPWPKAGVTNFEYCAQRESQALGRALDDKRDKLIEKILEGISFIRKVRQQSGARHADISTLYIVADPSAKAEVSIWQGIIEKLANAKLHFGDGDLPDAAYDTHHDGVITWHVLRAVKDREAQIAQLQKDLAYQRGFLASVEKKLSNERFVGSAPPHVVENERKKKADAEQKIKALEESLSKL
ncbi:MAG TPA: valine--tRNA ligase [Cyclobacteriaceae bacterium]|jgi:valyl-tRNA synthetase